MNFYELLEVPQGADAEEIKRAFRRLAKVYHPDVSTDPEATTKFRLIYTAYDILQDPYKRRLYDELQLQKAETGSFSSGESYSDYDRYDYMRRYAQWERRAASQAYAYSSMQYEKFEETLVDKVVFHSRQVLVLVFSFFVVVAGFCAIMVGFVLIFKEDFEGARLGAYLCWLFGGLIAWVGCRSTLLVFETWKRTE